MKSVIRWVGATLVGVLILGLVGVVGAAPASAASRTFRIVNNTKETWTLADRAYGGTLGCGGGDGFAPVGTQVKPGETYVYDMVYYFLNRCDAALKFNDNVAVRPGTMIFDMVVETTYERIRTRSAEHFHVAYSGSTTVTVTDKK